MTKAHAFVLALVLFSGAPHTRSAVAAKAKPIRALLVAGGCCHDYPKQKDILTQGISERADVTWAVAHDPDKGTGHKNPVYDDPDWAEHFDVIVHDECSSSVTDLEHINKVLEPHRKGLPAVVIHCGMHSYASQGHPNTTPWFEFTGLATTRHGPQLPIDISFVDKKSPITKKLESWTTVKEELYNNFSGKLEPTARALARGKQIVKDKEGKETVEDVVVAWTNT